MDNQGIHGCQWDGEGVCFRAPHRQVNEDDIYTNFLALKFDREKFKLTIVFVAHS